MDDEKKRLLKRRYGTVKFAANLLMTVPFLRCAILNGSFATGDFKESSDIDLLLVARAGRVFSVRFFSKIILKLFGLARSSDPYAPHAGKFCLNYFLTDSFLQVPRSRGEKVDRYCAENYSKSLLFFGNEEIFNDFMNSNRKWMKKYLKREPDGEERTVVKYLLPFEDNLLSFSCRRFWVAIFGGPIGNYFEKLLKNIQLKKIEKSKYQIKKYEDFIVFNDRELRFHPPKIGREF